MRHFIVAVMILSLTACGSPDTAPSADTPVAKAITEAGYDAALADVLGADDYGMRSYVMVILKTGPNDKTITDPEKRGEIFKGHFANMRDLAADKRLVLAGPFGDPDGIKRGLYIFNVKTVDEAKQLVLTDPAVKAGIFIAEFTPYYGSAALMQVNDVHQKIAKQNPG